MRSIVPLLGLVVAACGRIGYDSYAAVDGGLPRRDAAVTGSSTATSSSAATSATSSTVLESSATSSSATSAGTASSGATSESSSAGDGSSGLSSAIATSASSMSSGLSTGSVSSASSMSSMSTGLSTASASSASSASSSVTLSKRVFVSSTTYTGNFGGLAGGDGLCASLASAAGLGGTWMAWLSDSTGSPSTHFLTHSSNPYVLLDGTEIASSWTALTSGAALEHAIDLTEKMTPPPAGTNVCGSAAVVWSNTLANGTFNSTISCNSAACDCTDWTTISAGGAWGQYTNTDSLWASACNGGDCGYVAALYCFEQ